MARKYLAAAGAAAFAVALAASATAQASSPGCAFGNGCATLHGFDAASHQVAMDAKYQNRHEILIGYPDNPGDGASSFDGVLRFTPNGKTVTYQDTGLEFHPTITTLTCAGHSPTVPVASAGSLTNPTTLTVQGTTGTVVATPASGTALTVTGTGTLTVDEAYNGSACVEAYHYNVTGGTPALSSSNDAHLTFPVSSGNSQFTFTDSASNGSFSFTALPAGISVSGGTLTANTSTAVPGTYTNASATFTADDGAVYTATFTLVVDGTKVVNRNPDKPYYTFVYAPNGTWTSQCVTDVNGSGALKLEPCTLGRDKYQDFFALNGSGSPVQIADGVTTYHFQNWLASVANAGHSCLTDPSSLNPGTPQSDATDKATSPAGRQLRTDGSCAPGQNLWSWNT